MDERLAELEAVLRLQGVLTAAQLSDALGISQQTVSRLINAAGEQVVRLGRARATRYAWRREIGREGGSWPLYRLDASGRAEQVGVLNALAGGACHLESSAAPALLHDEFAGGLFPGLPWFLDDQRPQGFLGRTFGRRVAEALRADVDIIRWTTDDVLLAMLRFGEDLPGDLVLGDESLRAAQAARLSPGGFDERERATRYPELADQALRGEVVGSSAAGEQPKFAVTLRAGEAVRPVIVKFSERVEAAGGRRWADLLICEHLASEALRRHGGQAAQTTVIEAGGRVFLESTRFDRTAEGGRRGFVTLAPLDSAFYAHGFISWARFAPQLVRDGWLTADDGRALRRLWHVGVLIGNTDMHLGNAGLVLTAERPLALAPAYDLSPMFFRPAANGEVVPRTFDIALPLPGDREDWLAAVPVARDFWASAADDARISAGFRELAASALRSLERAAALA